MTRFNINPAWAVTRTSDGTSLIFSAGADLGFTEPMSDKTIFETIGSEDFSREDVPIEQIVLFEQLLQAGIIIPKIKKGAKKPSYAFIGDIFNDSLSQSLTKAPKDTADILIIVRQTSGYTDLLSKLDYSSIKKPHMLLDISTHHTISIGPLVFPGETACIACLQGRIEQRWGKEILPKKPQVAKYINLINALLSIEIESLFEGEDYSLVNNTLSYDVSSRTTSKNQLTKTTYCPICSVNNPILDKPLVLPSK